MISITKPIVILLFYLLSTGCSKQKESLPDVVFTGIHGAKNLTAYAGHGRVMISYVVDDINISYCEIFWDNKKQSRKIPRNEAIQDTVKTVIENLPEGDHSFEVFTYDSQNKPANASVKVLAKVYGDKYTAGLKTRTVTDLYFIQNKEPYINWATPTSSEVAIEVTYANTEGEKKTSRTPKDQFSTILATYKPNTPIQYRSLYLPEKQCIDTFYSASVTITAPTYYSSVAVKKIVEHSGLVSQVITQSSEGIHTDIEYSKLQFESNDGKPMSLFILKADLSKDNLTLSALMPNNNTTFALQTVKAMAEHRDHADGNVLAAINADFFEWTGVPWGPVYINGAMIRSQSKTNDLTYFAIKKDGKPQTGIFSQLSAAEHGNLRDVVGGGVHRLMVNGSRQVYGDQTPEPRTMIGYTSDNNIYLVVVDGRSAGYSAGITIDGLSAIMNSLQTFGAINLDGGGSSTMVVKRESDFEIVNRYSDANPRAVANGLAIITK